MMSRLRTSDFGFAEGCPYVWQCALEVMAVSTVDCDFESAVLQVVMRNLDACCPMLDRYFLIQNLLSPNAHQRVLQLHAQGLRGWALRMLEFQDVRELLIADILVARLRAKDPAVAEWMLPKAVIDRAARLPLRIKLPNIS